MPKDQKKAKEIRRKSIDLIDSKMIHLLQKDGRVANTEIAKRLEISEATVRSRLKRLIEEGFIQIVAVSNPFKLGFEIAGDLYIHVEMKKVDNILDKLKKLKELSVIGHPILVGASRKAFIRNILKEKGKEELQPDHPVIELGSRATSAVAILNGADILRVHDVVKTLAAIKVIDAVRLADQ